MELAADHRKARKIKTFPGVDIFTYRDERRLFALIGVIIVAALLALVQINAERSGTESPITTTASTLFGLAQTCVTAVVSGVRSLGTTILALPSLERDNAALRASNAALTQENAQLQQVAASYAAQVAVHPVVDLYHGVEASVIGFPPEGDSREVTINKGSSSGVQRDDGVLAAGGAVGRVIAVTPLTSQVVLITDYTSRVPAVVRRGRWWGIARGNVTSVRLEYVPQDAPLRIGDVVVTGQGRSFRAGIPLGRVVQIERGDATLYQTAVLKPSVELGTLDRVVVVPH
jgi:rod shape-determining protein MreC